jgi:hypothetical protein
MKPLTRNTIGLLVATLLPALIVTTRLGAQEAETLKDALAKGDASVALRYRYESVGDDTFEKNAIASTLRTALGYRTLPYKRVSLFLQAQNVAPVLNDNTYNNAGAGHLWNEVDERPVVADPAQTRMQQVYLRVNAFETAFDFGRREIFFGDHRFVGDVAWRQNHQAFDAVYLSNRTWDKATVSYTYAEEVIRINGGDQDMSSHFFNGVIDLERTTALELFGYLLDYTQAQDFRLSSQTYGFRLHGARPVSGAWRAHFEVEYARQSDYQDNPAKLGASYLELMGGAGYKTLVNVKLARELLGADDGPLAFQTPLATGHKFNGWADRFLVTPPDGLVDWNLTFDGKIRASSWLVRYHDFSADEGGAPYGSELDAQVTYSTPWNQIIAAKLALYRQDGFGADTSKFWFWSQYTF